MRSKWTPIPEKYELHKLDYVQSGMTNHFTVNCYVICHTKKDIELPIFLRLET